MTERLHFHFSLSCVGEGNGNPLQYSCLENPRDRGACWAAVDGVAESWTWLTWLSSSSSSSISLYMDRVYVLLYIEENKYFRNESEPADFQTMFDWWQRKLRALKMQWGEHEHCRTTLGWLLPFLPWSFTWCFFLLFLFLKWQHLSVDCGPRGNTHYIPHCRYCGFRYYV